MMVQDKGDVYVGVTINAATLKSKLELRGIVKECRSQRSVVFQQRGLPLNGLSKGQDFAPLALCVKQVGRAPAVQILQEQKEFTTIKTYTSPTRANAPKSAG